MNTIIGMFVAAPLALIAGVFILAMLDMGSRN